VWYIFTPGNSDCFKHRRYGVNVGTNRNFARDWEDLSVANTKNDEIVMDQRGEDRRDRTDRRKNDVPVAVDQRKVERRKTPRRRQIDPTTCERDYTNEEIEFMHALDEYKRTSGRMFPTCSEILEVLKNLGYQRVAQQSPSEELAAVQTENSASEQTASELEQVAL
jgi:hypothetical protein